MLYTFIKLALVVAAVGIGLYFTPPNVKNAAKDRAFALVSQVIPQTARDKIKNQVKEKLDPFVNTPVERRAKLLSQLETNIQNIKKQIVSANQRRLNNRDSQTSNNPTAENQTPTENPKTANQVGQTEDLLQKIDKALATIKKIETANEDQGIVSTITEKIINGDRIAPYSNCSWTCAVQP